MTTKLINCTPHEITTVLNGEVVERIPPSGTLARVSMATTTLEGPGVAGVPVTVEQPGEVMGLPEAQEGVFLIVSAMVRVACPHRTDLLSPGTLVRDEAGRPIGCGSFVSNF